MNESAKVLTFCLECKIITGYATEWFYYIVAGNTIGARKHRKEDIMKFKKLMKKLKKGIMAATFGAVITGTGMNSVMTYAGTAAEQKSNNVTARWEDNYLYIGNVTGNYVYIEHYSDTEGKKLKTTYLSEADNMDTAYNSKTGTYDVVFYVGDIQGTKGCSFRVYDEDDKQSEAVLVTAPAQEGKIKVKIADYTADYIYDVFDIKVGDVTIDSKNVKDYIRKYNSTLGKYEGDYISIDIADKEGVVTDSCNLTSDMKKFMDTYQTGATFVFTYHAEGKQPSKSVKAKYSAKAKAPKVAIDYENGTYTIPKKASYWIVKVTDGVAAKVVSESNGKSTGTYAEKKTVLTVDDILSSTDAGAVVTTDSQTGEKKVVRKAKNAALYVQAEATDKKPASNAVLLMVNELSGLTMTEGNDAAKTISIKENGTEIATIVFEEAAEREIATITSKEAAVSYSTDNGETWKKVKQGKEVKVKPDESKTVLIRRAGITGKTPADSSFSSAVITVKSNYVMNTAK